MCEINNPAYDFSLKGWECPKCGKVYSPYQYECTRCGQQEYDFGSPYTSPFPDSGTPNDFTTISTSEVDIGRGDITYGATPKTFTMKHEPKDAQKMVYDNFWDLF